jgi:hypothetical protein
LEQEPTFWDKTRSSGTKTEELEQEHVSVSHFLPQILPFTDLESNPFSRGDLKLKMLADSRDDLCNDASNGAF